MKQERTKTGLRQTVSVMSSRLRVSYLRIHLRVLSGIALNVLN